MVAERLKTLDVEVLAYDPFVTQEKADEYGVKLVSLETIFAECDVISNHLANKKELENIFNYKLFKLMKKRSTECETVFGQIKSNQKFRRFNLCGKQKVETEWGLLMLGYNVKQLIRLMNA